MYISIWQQFSSNHSGNFEIVGVFKARVLAHHAAETLREMFRAIDAERTAFEPYCHDCPPTTAEVSLAQQYGIEWGTLSLDWLVLDGDDVRNVSELEQFVFVTNLSGDNTWMGAKPIDQLIQNIGGEVMVTGEFYDTELRIDIRCTAPDESTAMAIYEQLGSYWRPHPPDGESHPTERNDFPPWINFWKGGEHILSNIWAGSVEDLVKQYLAEETARKTYLAEHAAEADRLTREMVQAYEAGDIARQDVLAKERYPHINYFPPEGAETLSLEQGFTAIHAIFDTAGGGEINRNGRELTITQLPRYKPGRFLPALVGFLRSKGCNDFQYDVGVEPFGED